MYDQFDHKDSDEAIDEAVYIQDGPDLFDEPLADPEPACDIAHRNGDLIVHGGCEEESDSDDLHGGEVFIRSGDARISEVEPPLALYRRYRPDDFSSVVGQEHVTKPLMRAIDNNRVNHAYLFSGPRGCGKTTSARILARCLNCDQGPTSRPCGQCDSCRALATGGVGSIDVIEIDAASHGRVDDARELREGVYFAPVASRYKIYIIDEAHMVTKEGFNALLKVVEEPPEHVKFIFATTEPDKVIGTIRSRTHHYPFHLVPPRVLGDYLATICDQEGVEVESGVLPLVVRAGAGSVRDCLSVLDQLLGGASSGRVTYDHASLLLGYTPESLLDEVVEAISARDGKAVFTAIDHVIDMGNDPRRFAEDLLQRIRDLIVISHVDKALESGLIDIPDDAGQRLIRQAEAFGSVRVNRAAQILADGLVAMRGSNNPRLNVEVMCSRLLSEDSYSDLVARMDEIDRRLSQLQSFPPAYGNSVQSRVRDSASSRPLSPQTRDRGDQSSTQAPPVHSGGHLAHMPESQRPASAQSLNRVTMDSLTSPQPVSDNRFPGNNPPVDETQDDHDIASTPSRRDQEVDASPHLRDSHGSISLQAIRDQWMQIAQRAKPFARHLMTSEAHPAVFDNGELIVSFGSEGHVAYFEKYDLATLIEESVQEIFGIDCKVKTAVNSPVPAPKIDQDLRSQPQTSVVSEGKTPRQRAEMAVNDIDDLAERDDEISEDDQIVDDLAATAVSMVIDEFDAEIISDPDDEKDDHVS